MSSSSPIRVRTNFDHLAVRLRFVHLTHPAGRHRRIAPRRDACRRFGVHNHRAASPLPAGISHNEFWWAIPVGPTLAPSLSRHRCGLPLAGSVCGTPLVRSHPALRWRPGWYRFRVRSPVHRPTIFPTEYNSWKDTHECDSFTVIGVSACWYPTGRSRRPVGVVSSVETGSGIVTGREDERGDEFRGGNGTGPSPIRASSSC